MAEPAATGLSRRHFLELTAAGLVVTIVGPPAFAQQRPARPARGSFAARFLLGDDGTITAFTSKVEVGQGSRTQISAAVAEELGVPIDRVQLVMADTALVPNDGGTFGSLTTSRTIPVVRRSAAAAREVLRELAARRLGVDPDALSLEQGEWLHAASNRRVSYTELSKSRELVEAFAAEVPDDMSLKKVADWQVLGAPMGRSGGRAVVTGEHRFPSDIKRPDMLYAAVLRQPSLGARLLDVELGETTSDGARAVRDGDLVAAIAPTSFAARRRLAELETSARWEEATDHPSSSRLAEVLRSRAASGEGRRARDVSEGDVEAALETADRVFRATYETAYLQHAPLEPRAAVAEWVGDQLTVWTGTQRPFGVRRELAQHFGVDDETIRVIVPDPGGAFGGKHTGECAVEAARIARVVGKPVSLRWSREEEMAWAYFRPAAVIDLAAAVGADGRLTAWEMVNLNSGASALISPYTVPNSHHRYEPADSPLRVGSYRVLAATANTFARESFFDELASAYDEDPLALRLKHLEDERLAYVLREAGMIFEWSKRRAAGREDGRGIGIACGTEKRSYAAACAEVRVDRAANRIHVERIVQTYECGAIQNPKGLRSQVEGCVVMALGGALRERIDFDDGKVRPRRLTDYPVPRFSDLPELEVVLVDRRDLDSIGAGETPMVAIAPAVANAVFDATGIRLRSLPLEEALRKSPGAAADSSA